MHNTQPSALRRHEAGDVDYRYILANERTFLAWIRTALALLAAGVAVRQLSLPFAVRHGRGLLSDLCLGLAVSIVVLSYRRWRAAHHAMADAAPLPSARVVNVLTWGMMAIALIATALMVPR